MPTTKKTDQMKTDLENTESAAGAGSSPSSCSPFALVTLETLTIKRFDHKEDWQTAMNAIQARGQDFVALKYHAGARRYVVPERYE